MDILSIVILSLGSVLAIFLLTKLMGYRQMSQMSMFDYIIGITIGSIAAEMSTALDDNYTEPLTAMIVYALVAVGLAILSSKSMKARRIIEGIPVVLFNHGEIFYINLKKAKMDVSEFLMQCRVNGYFDIEKLECVILEGNGKLSFLPKAQERPLTPADMNLMPDRECMVANVILDGNIMQDNLHHVGKDEKWLRAQIKAGGAKDISEVLLATCDCEGKVTVYLRANNKLPHIVL
ncbi:MAG: DUF421 domain-containing protein [Lachnospiraceae bacterium]